MLREAQEVEDPEAVNNNSAIVDVLSNSIDLSTVDLLDLDEDEAQVCSWFQSCECSLRCYGRARCVLLSGIFGILNKGVSGSSPGKTFQQPLR
jgi:hypothetical protein